MRATHLELSFVSIDLQQGHIVTLEITSGEVYRGKLIEGTPSIICTKIESLLTGCS
jgi:hypothetical protein